MFVVVCFFVSCLFVSFVVVCVLLLLFGVFCGLFIFAVLVVFVCVVYVGTQPNF